MKNLIFKPKKQNKHKLKESSSLPILNCFETKKKEKKYDNRIEDNKNKSNIPFDNRSLNELIKRNNNKRNLNNKNCLNLFATYNNNFNSTKTIFDLKVNKNNSTIISDKNIKIENERIIKLKKELNIIWDDLCVLESYKELFEVISYQLDINQRIDFYQSEINSINIFRFKLLELKKNIKERINCISQLKNLNIQLSNILKKKSSELKEEILENISEEIQKLRKYTINIVNSFINFRKGFNQFSIEGKYNINKLEKRFCFDKNYLLKLNEELSFIKDSNIKFFFNINDDNSPFLIKASDNDSFIRKVPITNNERKEINKCQFLIYQDLIFNQNKNYNENSFRKISPIKKHSDYFFNTIDTNSQSELNINNYENKKNDNPNKLNNYSRNNPKIKSISYSDFHKNYYDLS